MDYTLIGILIVSVAAVFILLSQVRWLSWKWLGKAMLHFMFGIILLLFINLFGNFFDFHIPLNLVTISISGFLGIPGALALIIIKLFIIL